MFAIQAFNRLFRPQEILITQLEANDPTLTSLTLKKFPTNAHKCGKLGRAIGNNTILKSLSIVGDDNSPDFPPRLVEELCRGIAQNRSIEKITFGFGFHFYRSGESLQLMIPFFQNNRNLKEIIDDNVLLSHGFDLVWSILRLCKSLRSIRINGLSLNKFTMTELLTVLNELPLLERISVFMGIYVEMSVELSQAFTSIIQNPQSNLNTLHVDVREMNKEFLVALALSLKCNTTLKTLKIGAYYSPGWEVDPTVFARWNDLLRFHNDTLEEFAFWPDMPVEVKNLLLMNQWDDKDSVRLRKGLDFDFLLSDRPFNADPFNDKFDLRLLPYVLSSIGKVRSERDSRSVSERHSALYYFVQSMLLLIVESGRKLQAVTRRVTPVE